MVSPEQHQRIGGLWPASERGPARHLGALGCSACHPTCRLLPATAALTPPLPATRHLLPCSAIRAATLGNTLFQCNYPEYGGDGSCVEVSSCCAWGGRRRGAPTQARHGTSCATAATDSVSSLPRAHALLLCK